MRASVALSWGGGVFGGTLCSSSNATKYESIAPHQDYVESRTIAHMRDDEKLFFVYFSFWEVAL